MARVITTRRNSTYTLKIIGEDGKTQLRLALDGPLPDPLRVLMARGNAGDMGAAEKYVTEFIRHWHSNQPSDWLDTASPARH